jgi:thiaminase/transcriptional activator TenA
MSRSAALTERHAAALDVAARHPLLAAMTDGSVSPAVFARYLTFEGVFVRTAARTAGYLVWQAPAWDDAARHAQTLAGLVGEQAAYFTATGADASIDVLAADPGPLGRHVASAVAEGGYGAAVSCFAAAETLYENWCRSAAATAPPRAIDVQRWISLHTSPGFVAGARFLRSCIDKIPSSELPDAELDRWFGGMLAAENDFHSLPMAGIRSEGMAL